ncbi:hypothetical protein Smp_129300 [Schistosoma mansoni]|uniref:hypothetical protein n=1 Tax=Schistosoma mansoni TaxID=6183 RepID=UPI00022C8475|nr:hypothetical protein Smp_129300 [Schistosoma mansoni]|eukprot:XP_018645727.1 hypothetical protein Smp_129300 [Schistosoma mansoni]
MCYGLFTVDSFILIPMTTQLFCDFWTIANRSCKLCKHSECRMKRKLSPPYIN